MFPYCLTFMRQEMRGAIRAPDMQSALDKLKSQYPAKFGYSGYCIFNPDYL